jgi:hypothetical protein
MVVVGNLEICTDFAIMCPDFALNYTDLAFNRTAFAENHIVKILLTTGRGSICVTHPL